MSEAQDRALQDVRNEFVESRREKTRLQEDLLRKEKALWDTQIRSMHELEKMKRAQVQQVDEMSTQKLKTIQHTSQLQQLPEQMNSMNSSGEFQDIESKKKSGRLCHVSSQLEMIPSSRALLSRDKRLLLDTWNQSGVQENFFGNQFSTFESHRDFPQRISSENVHRKAIPHQPKGKQVWQVETDKIMAQFQCRLLRQDRWPLVVQYRWNYTRITWSDSKDSKCRNLQFNKFPTPASFLVWKTRFKTQVAHGSDFPSNAMMCIKRSGDGWFFGWAKIFTISIRERFSRFWDAGRKDCLGSEQDHPEFPVQKEGQPRGAECPKRGPVPERETIAFMIYDYFRVTAAHDTVLDYSDLFSITLRTDNVQEFDTRWHEVLSSTTKIPSDELWRVCTN